MYFTKILDNCKRFLYNLSAIKKGGLALHFANHTGRNTQTENRKEKSFP